jgi:hypothetical protein
MVQAGAAISFFQTVTNYEIASLRSQRRLLKLFMNESKLFFSATCRFCFPFHPHERAALVFSSFS